MELNQSIALCRACLTEEGIFRSVFLVDSNSGFSLKISEMLSSFSMIQVIQGDGLPDQICTKCVEKTVKMYLFKLKFEESDIILRAKLEKVSPSNKANFINKVKAETAELLGITEEDDLLPSHKINKTIKTEELEIKDEHCFQVNCDFVENANLIPKIENMQSVFFCQEDNKFVDKKEHLADDISGFHKNKKIRVSCYGVEANQFADIKFDLKNKPYGCDICFEGFSQKSNLRDHMRTHNSTSSNDFLEKSEITDLQKHTGEISFSCPNSSNLIIDEKNCTNEETYKSDVSKIKSTKFQNFILQTKTGKRPFECHICEKKFKYMDNLISHKIIHTGEKQFKCDMCEKIFIRIQQLTRHKKTHSDKRPFECHICKKKFKCIENLISHKRIHTGEKPFKCDMCEKKFTRKNNLISHKKTHTGEKPFECDICKKKCTYKQDLIKHKKIHTGEKPFKCDICEKFFLRMAHLISHKRIHTGEKPFECDMCEMKFTQMHILKRHKKSHSGKRPFECHICEKRFKCMDNLISHKKIHTGEKPFECDMCDKNFIRKNNLISHKGTHTGEKPFKCDICEKNFAHIHSLTRHKITHTGDKPFECDMCEKNFTRKNNLISHKRTHTGDKPFKCGKSEKKLRAMCAKKI